MQLLKIFQEIANHIQIESSNFCISHTNYQTVETAPDILVQLKKMPQEIQFKYFNLLLRDFIYGVYFNGLLVQNTDPTVKTDYQTLENNASVEVDWELYEQLHNNNKGTGWFNPDYRILRQEMNGSLAVCKFGITIHIERERHLQLVDQSATVGDLVAIRMPPGTVQNGLYMAIGDAAGNLSSPEDNSHQTVSVYFNFNPEGAVTVMKGLTTRLNAIEVPFSFGVLYNHSNYGRYNSGIFRFDNSSYELVKEVLETIYTENKQHFHAQVPLFTKVLAPGMGLAEWPVPELQFIAQESFGHNRCQIVANALLEAHQNGNESPEVRMKYILQHFAYLGIELEHPYLNPNSEDIYKPLDLNVDS